MSEAGKYFRAIAPCNIKEGESFLVDLVSAKVLVEKPFVAETERDAKIREFWGVHDAFKSDSVNHPSHYNKGKIEVIEFIEDQKMNYHIGNLTKYIARAGHKDPSKEVEDLEKARWYLDRYIEVLKAAKENREPKRPNQMVTKNTLPVCPKCKEYELKGLDL